MRAHRAVGSVAIALACACGGGEPPPDEASGTFRGVSSDGAEIVLTLEQEGGAVRGRGTIGGEPVALAGARSWTASGTLVDAAGTRPIRLGLAAEGGLLELVTRDDSIVLERGADAEPAAPGPFSGTWEAEAAGGVAAEISIVQSGSLLAGAGTLLGDPVGVTGRVEGSRAQGAVTWADESRVPFRAVLSDDGDEVTLSGLGADLALERR